MNNFHFRFPPVQEYRLDNGLHCLLVPDTEQDAIVMALQLPFGRFNDPPGLEGITELTLGCIQKGTMRLNGEQFSEELESAGTSIFTEVGEEYCIIGIRMLSSFAAGLVPLFWEMICTPRFDREELKRLRKEMVTSIQAEAVDPSSIANRHFFSLLVPPGHPASLFHTIKSIRRLTVDKVRSFYTKRFFPRGAIFLAGGNFDNTKFREMFEPLATTWVTTGGADAEIAPAVPFGSSPKIRLIDKPDSTQTTLIMGHTAPGELTPDKNIAALANYIFGASNFSSRLMTRVRSEQGQTYGIVSQISSERHFGSFTISTTTLNTQLNNVLESVINEYGKFCRDGVTGEELEFAKNFAFGNMSFQLEGINNIADKLLWLRFYGRSNEYIEQFDRRLEVVTLEYMNRCIRHFFSAENLIITAVGKKQEILSALRRYGEPETRHFRAQP